MSVLIKNGTLITMNPTREIINTDLLIEGDRIAQIAAIDSSRADTVIDAQGKLVIPGLIQTHIHLCQTLFRGMADDLELLDWLRLRIWPLEAAHDEESLYYCALLACGELLRGGTTSVIDMATLKHTDSVFKAVSLAGVRYLGGKCMMDKGGEDALLVEDRDLSIRESLDLMKKWNGYDNGRIRYAFCPRFVPSCSHELLKQVRMLSEQYKIPVHTHASENRSEIELVEKEHGLRNIKYLDKLELCNDRLILAHCIHLDEEEKNILVKNKVNIAHCPSCNLKLGSGIAAIPDLLKRGGNISIGADGAPANNNLSMFVEMRLAALIQKPWYGASSMSAQTVFEMATLGGARAMGLEQEIGSLEIGKKADIAVVNIENWHCWPVSNANYYAQLVYQVQTQDVDSTIVDGQILMQNGELKSLPKKEIFRRAESCLNNVKKRAGLY